MNISEHASTFIQEMDRRGFADSTIEQYSSCVKMFFSQVKKDHPKNVNEQDIKDYLYQFSDPNTQRSHHSAIKKYYEIILKQKNKFRYIPYTKKSYARPIIPSMEEMAGLLKATDNLKHFCITLTLYSTGVRINELLSIKFPHIDRANMVIHIINGKGMKQRQVTMKLKLLKILEVYYKTYKPKVFLFENPAGGKYSERSVNEFLKANAKKAGIKKHIHAHLLRHAWASHSLEHGENLYTIQQCAGHSTPVITANTYIHGSSKIIANAYSPIDSLPLLNQRLQLHA